MLTGTLIAYNTGSLQEYAAGACICIEPGDHEAFGDALNRLYKEELLKTKMGEEAAVQTAGYVQAQYAEQLWQLLTQQQA